MRRKILLGTTVLAGLVLAAPAFAQSAPASSDQPAASTDTVVVTGSRIKRTNFTSASPIQVITSEESTLEGLADTSQIIQQSAVANNSQQINNFFSGFLTNGGAGANTISLRGLGEQRTLVLLNGRRAGPAGTGGTVGPFDLNTIPSSIIDHVEILKDGASSIYGSDAVAGVVNIVTKKNLDGGNIDAYINPGQQPGGETYRLSASWGHTFNRGYITVAGDYYEQEALHFAQRDYLNCSKDYDYSLDKSTLLDIIDNKTGQSKCNNVLAETVINASNGRRYSYDPTAVAGGSNGNDYNGLRRVAYQVKNPDGSINVASTEATYQAYHLDDPNYLKNDAITPVKRWTFMAFGAYDLNNSNQIYGEFQFNRRISSVPGIYQFFPLVDYRNPSNVFNAATNPGYTGPLGYAEPVTLYAHGTDQEVNYVRGVVGIKGDLPNISFLKNFSYDLYGQYSHSDGDYGQSFIYQDRVDATTGPTACDPTFLTSTTTCMPVNYLRASSIQGDNFTQAEHNYLFGYEKGNTTYDHAYIEGSISGDLFQLPAGPLGVALGFQSRYEKIDDQPGPQAAANNYWGFSTAGVTKGHDTINEAFGELNIPVLKNVPFAESLEFDLSGRISDYKSAGTAKTYKASVNWQIVPWLRFRASQGTSFRAPALYELFLGNQLGFLGQNNDPCVNYVANGANANIQANCASQGIPGNYTGISPNGGGGGSFEDFSGGGAGHLKPETSTARVVGLVFTPKWFNLDFSLAVDYTDLRIHNEITQFGAGNILYQCYNQPTSTFPHNDFCSLFTRDLNTASPSYLNILTVQDDYVNVQSQSYRGIDATIRFTHKLPWGVNFRFNSDLTWTLETSQDLLGSSSFDLNGSPGYPDFDGDLSFRFDKGPWSLNWFTEMVGKTSGTGTFGSDTNTLASGYRNTGVPFYIKQYTPFYAIHTISVRRRFQDFTFTAGIKNLFDKAPPTISSGALSYYGREVTIPVSSQYDLIGRSFFLEIEKKF